MRQSLGLFLQICCLSFLPLLIGWQLMFGMPIIVMPIALVISLVIFSLAHELRRK